MSATATTLSPPIEEKENNNNNSRPTTADTSNAEKKRFSFLKSKADDKHLSSVTDDASSDTRRDKTNEKEGGKDDNDGKDGVKETFPPVPFFDLYKFSTTFERVLMVLGLFCAVLSGAAQVSLPSFFNLPSFPSSHPSLIFRMQCHSIFFHFLSFHFDENLD
jgi:hypothetical protein